MSLIHTCQLCGANAFDYLTELERHANELSAAPERWMPGTTGKRSPPARLPSSANPGPPRRSLSGCHKSFSRLPQGHELPACAVRGVFRFNGRQSGPPKERMI